jgi:hypothetical protein
MEHLKVGKTPEEAGHFLGFVADTKFYLQCQDLDTRDRGAWALLSPSLHAPREKLIKIIYWYALLTDRGKIRSSRLQTEMTVLPISITCFPGSRYPSTRWRVSCPSVPQTARISPSEGHPLRRRPPGRKGVAERTARCRLRGGGALRSAFQTL